MPVASPWRAVARRGAERVAGSVVFIGAFVLDPDGNNIEAVFHGEAKRSADSIEVTFDA